LNGPGASASRSALAFEDLSVGDHWESRDAVTVSEAMIREFAERYDPQPFHLDEERARNSVFGRLVASGWHTAALTMAMIVEARPFGDTPVIGSQVDRLRWAKPVLPGDRLSLFMEVIETQPSQNRPGRGRVRLRITVTNQAGEEVYSIEPTLMLPSRAEIEGG
jgi:acyl dehydratase